MAYRTFTDRNGHAWEVRNRSSAEWELSPVRGNPYPVVPVPAPGYEKDPFEMSIEELQRLLDSAPPPPPSSRSRKSPFKD